MSDYKKLWENPANPELEVAIQSAEAANVCTAGTRELTPEELEDLLREEFGIDIHIPRWKKF